MLTCISAFALRGLVTVSRQGRRGSCMVYVTGSIEKLNTRVLSTVMSVYCIEVD